MNDQIFTRGPHNYLVKVAQHAKNAQASSHDERVLTHYIGQLGQPDNPNEDYGNGEALETSHHLGAHLALAKIAQMRGDHAKLGKHLDEAMQHHAELHAGLHGAAHASEMDPNAIREEQN